MQIKRIFIKDNKYNPLGYVERAYLEESIGMIGDIHSKGGDQQISIISEEGRRTLDNLDEHGLCSSRFQENITIDNLVINKYKVGDMLKLGLTILQITKTEKKCFPDCNLYKSNKPCILTEGVLYCKVILGGEIHLMDQVISYSNSL